MAKQQQKQTSAPKRIDVASQRQSIKSNAARPESQGLPGHEQDPKRRLGNFTGTGEHARQGGREAGIVGQKKGKLHND